MTKKQRKRGISLLRRMRDGAAMIAHLDSNPDETRATYDTLIASLSDEAESDRKLGAAVRGVLHDFGWDHATVRAEVESERLAETVEGCIFVAIERALREEGER